MKNIKFSFVEEPEEGVRLLVTAKEGIHQINAKAVVDATGDANSAVRVQAPCMAMGQAAGCAAAIAASEHVSVQDVLLPKLFRSLENIGVIVPGYSKQ